MLWLRPTSALSLCSHRNPVADEQEHFVASGSRAGLVSSLIITLTMFYTVLSACKGLPSATPHVQLARSGVYAARKARITSSSSSSSSSIIHPQGLLPTNGAVATLSLATPASFAAPTVHWPTHADPRASSSKAELSIQVTRPPLPEVLDARTRPYSRG
ncbi:hypothetical protein CALCODRAFT_28813 [Calocera cornea HHB12733]|uniref:Uncharacterized protein n=1 Tax=Calocera cornea HHB12733 TaxID=1353952 RepID=A0A165E3N3_9BASI|nr:hypothetical protein CALCODRAFT_28813 [Calocera cornea HHB12733]